MPNHETFDIKPIGDFVRKYLYGVSVDPFARNKNWATHTNDLNPNTTAQHHMDAESFLLMLYEERLLADCIILDPPYSPRQISECYASAGIKVGMKDTQNAALYSRVRKAARRICHGGTVVLSFGWNSAGMGEGFERIETLLVAHGGAHNDTICVADRCIEMDAMTTLKAAYAFADRLRA